MRRLAASAWAIACVRAKIGAGMGGPPDRGPRGAAGGGSAEGDRFLRAAESVTGVVR